MKQIMLLKVEMNKDRTLTTVLDWMNEKILGSIVTEVDIQNMDLIYCGSLHTFLGEIIISSGEAISADELKRLFNPHPHFIHKIEFKART